MSKETHRPPPFLAHLGLDETADDRTIRRAYARLLKQIDQENDPDGFQSLRQAYEVSLHWFAHRQQAGVLEQQEQATPAGTNPAGVITADTEGSTGAGDDPQEGRPLRTEPLLRAEPPASAESFSSAESSPRTGSVPAGREPDSSPSDVAALRQAAARAAETSAREVFDAMRAMLPQRRRGAREKVQAWLQQALEGERLIDMDARFLFEGGVASLLANGWQPGHEYLFGPAMECFGWRRDRGRLAAFGRAGAVIASAIDELDFYDAQPRRARSAQRDLIRRLRDNGRPSTGYLLRHHAWALHLRRLFPHWMHVITCADNVERWSGWAKAVPRWRRWLTYAPSKPPAHPAAPFSMPAPSGRIGNGWIIFGVLIVCTLLRTCLQSTSPPPAPPVPPYVQHSPSSGNGPSGSSMGTPPRRAGPDPLAFPAVRAVPVAPLQPIYPAEARRLGHEGRVVVSATVGFLGRTRDVSIAQSSGHRDLDDAALAAVRDATFRPAKDDRGNIVESSYRIPFNFVLADRPAGGITAQPSDYGQRVREAFQSQILLPDALIGNPVAEVELRLSARGVVESYRLVRPSGSKDWDAAVQRAVARVKRVPADDKGQVPPKMVITFQPKP